MATATTNRTSKAGRAAQAASGTKANQRAPTGAKARSGTQAMADMPATAIFEQSYELMTTLGQPTRARIFWMLYGASSSVSDLCAALGEPQTSVSSHLRHLRKCGAVVAEGESRERVYSITSAGKTWFKALRPVIERFGGGNSGGD
jgi:DNA-binding transcriptional ArsR family regulator